MIVTPKVAIRLGILGLLAVILQVSFFSYLLIFGATPNLLPVVVCSVGLFGGAVTGACFGFSVGFLLDALLLQPLGAWALVLLGVGYLAGRYREAGEVEGRRRPAILAGVLTLLAGVAYAVLQIMVGLEAAINLAVVRDALVGALLAGLLSFGVHPTVRLMLRPALVADEPGRGRLASVAARLPRLGGRRRRRRELDRERARRRERTEGSRGIGDSSHVEGGLA